MAEGTALDCRLSLSLSKNKRSRFDAEVNRGLTTQVVTKGLPKRRDLQIEAGEGHRFEVSKRVATSARLEVVDSRGEVY